LPADLFSCAGHHFNLCGDLYNILRHLQSNSGFDCMKKFAEYLFAAAPLAFALTLLLCIWIVSCQKAILNPEVNSERVQQQKSIAHYELLSRDGHLKYIHYSCIIHLTKNYRTDKTDSVILVSLQHQNDYLFHGAAKDSLHYPYIGYFFDINRNGFVAVDGWDLRDTIGLSAWFESAGNAFELSSLDTSNTHFCIHKEIKPEK
jgi:hypothetical protein